VSLTAPFSVAASIPWEKLTEAKAGAITVAGLTAVFTGLVLLCLFMILLKRLFGPTQESGVSGVAAEDGTNGQTAKVVETKASVQEKGAAAPLSTANQAPEASVELSIVTAASLALDLHDQEKIALGSTAKVRVGGKLHQTTVLATGFPDRVVVDGEEVAMLRSRVAPDTAPASRA
jgi:hypothetical protein